MSLGLSLHIQRTGNRCQGTMMLTVDLAADADACSKQQMLPGGLQNLSVPLYELQPSNQDLSGRAMKKWIHFSTQCMVASVSSVSC